MTGKVCVVTGASSGIGRATALELARRGAHVVLACRSLERGEQAAAAMRAGGIAGRVELLELDLASLAAVRRSAAELLGRGHPIHVLINNAGLGGGRGVTRDGFERAFGVNHLGHFLLTRLLQERIRASAPARIVNVASKAHYGARGIDFAAVRQSTTSWAAIREYETSKLANVLFSAELGRRLAGTGVSTYAVHPGVIGSNIWRHVPWPMRPLIKLFMKSNEAGAEPVLRCATAPELAAESGRYYDETRPAEPSRSARDEALARELWERSEAWCAER